MRILVCLLSDQHVPNLLSVHHFEPDRLVLVESKAMQVKKAAEHFRSALKLGRLSNVADACVIESLDLEDDLDAVRRCLQRAYGKYPADEWIANISGGTKPMSIAAYEFFKAVGARLVYVNFSRPDDVLALDGSGAEKCAYQPTIREFLAGYGFGSSKSLDDIAKAEERGRLWWNCSTAIAQHADEQLLLRLGDLGDPTVKKRWDDARKKGMQLVPGNLIAEHADVRAEIVRAFSLNDTPEGLIGPLDKYAVEFFTGGWLEIFIWGLLTRHAEALGVWDVRLGIKPAKIGVSVDNDFDVAFMHGYRLWMVECKSGSQAYDSGAEILNKVEAIVRQFRALGVRSCLATTSSNVLKDGELKPSVRDRAGIYQCRIVIRDQIRRLARSPGDSEHVRAIVLGNHFS